MPRRGGRRKKTRTHDLKPDVEAEVPGGPCSFIVKKGRVGKALGELVGDLRQLMSPNTYSKLRESKGSSTHDYTQVAGTLGATHLIRVSNTEKNIPHVHLSRLPAGPSFDLRVDKFSLMSDIRSLLESGGGIGLSKQDEQFAPVAILNGFKNASSNEFVTLLCEALKGLIPPIDISKINTKTCRRVVLFNYDADSNILSIRHYRVKIDSSSTATTESNVSSATCAAILRSRKTSKIPNLGKLVSLTDLLKPSPITNSHDSGAEPPSIDNCQVEIYGKKSSTKKSKAQLNLVEIGPRIECTLSRVFSGVEEGTVLFAPSAPETVGKSVAKKLPKRKRTTKSTTSTTHKKSKNNYGENHRQGDEEEEQYFSE